MNLVLDTETTGLYHYDLPALHPDQPWPVEIAARLYPDSIGSEIGKRRCVAAFTWLIIPAAWEIPPDATAIHGIDRTLAIQYGVCLDSALTDLLDLCGKAQILIAHNLDFDRSIINSCARHAAPGFFDCPPDGIGKPVFHRFQDLKQFCTMRAMTPICQIPKPDLSGWKFPSLAEASQFAFHKPPPAAHHAMLDAITAARLYFWLLYRPPINHQTKTPPGEPGGATESPQP